MTNLATRILFAVLSVASLSTFIACSRDTKTTDGYTPPTQCQLDGTCDAGQGGTTPDGSMAGQGGGGMGGSSGAGGEDGGAGTGGMGGSSGQGGAGGSDACEPACTDPEPVCDEATETCVQCLSSDDCEGHQDGPVCVDGTCQQCAEAQDCIDQDAGSACVENQCVQCNDDTHCTDPGASHCDTDTNECGPCQTHSHCEGIQDGDAELGLCREGQCVQCTRHNIMACGRNAQDQPYVCDVQQGRCSDEHTVESTGTCGACVSDAQCKDGRLCVQQTFTENQSGVTTDIGYFCLWQKQAGTDDMPVEDDLGAPKGNCPDIPPYVRTRADVESIERQVGTVCGQRTSTSTCLGVDHFSDAEIECAPDGEPDNARCGHPDVEDAYCRQIPGSSTYRCTMRCGGSDDCINSGDCVDSTYCTLE